MYHAGPSVSSPNTALGFAGIPLYSNGARPLLETLKLPKSFNAAIATIDLDKGQ